MSDTKIFYRKYLTDCSRGPIAEYSEQHLSNLPAKSVAMQRVGLSWVANWLISSELPTIFPLDCEIFLKILVWAVNDSKRSLIEVLLALCCLLLHSTLAHTRHLLNFTVNSNFHISDQVQKESMIKLQMNGQM